MDRQAQYAAYRVTTPTATIGVRGTDHEVTVVDKGDGDEPGTYDTVNEGATVMKTPHGEVEATPGKFAFAPKGRAAAPAIMAQHPRFWARRSLRMEGRIQQRKEGLRGRFEQMREERNRNFRQIRNENPRGERGSERSDEKHGEARAQERPRAAERRNEAREQRAERIQRRREEIRERRKEKVQREEKAGEGQREHKQHARRERE